jgi:probable phosphomutase (TIGR03848 family)
MPTVLLVRHGRTTANTSGVLAGWTPGVRLDEHGEEQARALASRMAPLPLAAVVSSPLERCQQTAQALRSVPGPKGVARPEIATEERLGECRYGDWTGRELKSLTRDPMWKVVQEHPSAAVFPGPEGESMRAMQLRAVDAVRDWDRRMADEQGPEALWVAVSHGDVIKAVLADALGAHLDQFQRIVVSPCSVSVVTYTPTRPFVGRMNDAGADLAALAPHPRRRTRRRPSSDAVVGGSAA